VRFKVPNIVFFGSIGFTADLFNFAAAQAEILAGTFVFHGSGLQLGIVGACTNVFYALTTLIAGLLSERLGRRPLILAGLTGLAVSYLWGAYISSIRELYLVVSLRAVATAFLWPPLMAWMARAVPPKKFSRFLGTYNLSWALGAFFGFWGAGYLFQNFGWTTPFLTAFLLAASLIVCVLLVDPEGGNGIAAFDEAADDDSHHGLDPQQAYYFVRQGLLAVVTGTVAISVGLYIFPKVAQDLLSEVQISLLNSLRLAGQMITFFLMGRYGAWHFKKWPVWMMALILCLGLVLLATGYSFAVFVLGFLLLGVGFGAGFSMCAYYALGLSRTKGKGSGLMETMIGTGGLSGSLLGGVMANLANARMGLLSTIVPVIIGSWIAARRMARRS